MHSRREVLKYATTTVAMIGTSTILPYAAQAAGQDGGMNTFKTASGEIRVHPVSHASFVMETPGAVIYNDPVGGADAYSGYPAPDLILITHEHGDHYNADTLAGLVGEGTRLLANPAVYDMLPGDLKARAQSIGNGESTTIDQIRIDAIPAYNTTEDRLKYHPKGRDNGYVLTIDGIRVYIAGDTEDIPEMRSLENIELAFLPMNLPYTMDIEQASSAIVAFRPAYVYPYHYRGSDIDRFEELVASSEGDTRVLRAQWYS